MTAMIIAAAFLGLDLVLVIAALMWLAEQRAMADITDLRYRDRRRPPRL